MARKPDPSLSLQERVPSRLFELSLCASSAAAWSTVRAVLMATGFAPHDLASEEKGAGHMGRIYFEDKARAEKFHRLFQRLNISGLTVKLSVLKPKDWLTRWKREWKPARLTQTIDVVPVWYKAKYKPRRGTSVILMDTLLSFGTGLHETTQLMAQMIEDHREHLASVLDIGTGTGVLAMVALRHGAKDVAGIDIGDLSVQAARDNLKVNGLKAVVKKADIRTFRPGRRYDFVAANLITHDLIASGRRIASLVKPGGLLAVSGISLDNLSQLQEAFSRLPLRCREVRKGKQWAGLLYQR